MTLIGAACQSESVTVSPPPNIRARETTLAECVAEKGGVLPGRPGQAAFKTFKTLKPGVLTVGSFPTNPPFESIEDGKPVGFDIGLIAEIARRLDLRTEVRAASTETALKSLAARELDVVASALTITEDRKRIVDFTDPYLTLDQSLVVRIVEADMIEGVADLSKRLIGVRSASPGEDCAKRALKAGAKVAGVRSYTSLPEALEALLDRRVHAVMGELPGARQEVERRPGLAIVEIIHTDEEYGFALTKDNPNLREAINRQLAEIQADGTYLRIHQRWLGTPGE
ncbi:MAG: ABC transporter substrate-binding protein [Actinomycetota bacterium]